MSSYYKLDLQVSENCNYTYKRRHEQIRQTCICVPFFMSLNLLPSNFVNHKTFMILRDIVLVEIYRTE